jgi:hypothetical protein
VIRHLGRSLAVHSHCHPTAMRKTLETHRERTGNAQARHRLPQDNGPSGRQFYLSPLSSSLTRTRKTGSPKDKERPSVWPMSIPLNGTSRKTGWLTSGGPQRPTCPATTGNATFHLDYPLLLPGPSPRMTRTSETASWPPNSSVLYLKRRLVSA